MRYKVRLECGHEMVAEFAHAPVLAREAVACEYCHTMVTVLDAALTVESVSTEEQRVVEVPPAVDTSSPLPAVPTLPTAAERRVARKADKAAAAQQAAQDAAEHQADLDVAHEEQAAEDRKEDREFSESQ